MPNSYLHKNSSTPSSIPQNFSIQKAEIAVNLVDKILFSKDGNNDVFLVKADPLYNTGLQDKLDLKADLANPTFTGNTVASNVSITGTLLVTSTAQVTNLNADFLDGQHGTFYTTNSTFASHTSNLSNPHVVTTTQLGLENVTNESKLTMFTNPVFTNPSYEGTLTGNTGVINIGSGQLYKAMSGKVGINTTNPISILTIKGTTETDAPILSEELLTTGGWTVNSGWTGTNPFTHTTGTDTLTHDFVVGVGNLYQFVLTMTGRNAGGVTLNFGGLTTQSYTTSAAGGTVALTTDGVVITPTSDFDGTITVSCKQITNESTPLLTLQDSSGAGRFELRTNLLGNVLIGRDSGRYITTGLYNTGVGDNTLSYTMGGDFNVGVGSYAMYNNTEGGYNTAVGVNTLGSNSLGSYNSAYGTQTMLYSTIGSYNSAYGYQSMQTNVDGNYNAAFGYKSLFTNLSGSYNAVFGPLAGYSITVGERNVAVGYNTLYYNQDGDDNLAIGHDAGSFQNDGITPLLGIGQSIYVGTDSRGSANGEVNAIVIGYNSLGKGTNTTVLGNANTESTYIFGNLALGSISTPTEKLDVTGNIKATGNVTSNILISTVASGTSPIKVASDTLVTNLNADLLDGQHGSYYSANSIFADHTANVSNPHVTTASQVGLGAVTNESKATMFTTPTFSGVTTTSNTFTSTVAIGSAPFVVASDTLVTNLNADLLDGQHGSYYSANSIFADHTANVSNPHVVTTTQLGLENVTNESKATMFTSPTFTGATTSANTFTSTVASGNAPFVVTSNTLVTNLNADLLDGQHGSYYSANSIFADHTANVSNPHVVTTTQLGLENVTNESKATMFTSPTFTGATTSANTFTSTVGIGNAPFVVTSNTVVTNLNADLLDGQHGSYYSANSIFADHTANVSNPHVVTATQVGLGAVTNESKATLFTTPTFSGVTTTANTFTSTVAIGNAPFVVASNTLVTNLNADLLDGQHGTYYSANSIFADHTANTSNPHVVTATQVGLGSVTNESKATLFTSPTFSGDTTTANTFTSTVAIGNSPFLVTSNTVVTNLNADLLDGQHGSYYSANSIFADHTANVSNPHVVTATQVGLGAVTNESKATMFTNSVLTGIPTAPTALVATSNTQIATTAFVHSQVAIDKPLTGYVSNNGPITSADTILSAIEKLNGNDTLKDYTTFKTSPTGVPTTNGTLSWDSDFQTLKMNSSDITLQIGQEELAYCYNDTGTTIPNGSVVYISGSNGDTPTIGLAIANNLIKQETLGVTTQAIPSGVAGFVTVRGIVHDVNTSTYTPGAILYLSSSVFGGMTETIPTDPTLWTVKVGTTLVANTSGSIYVRQVVNNKLSDLYDVNINIPVTDDILKYNGAEWINGPSAAVTAGQGTTFFLDDADIIVADANYVRLKTLTINPSITQEAEANTAGVIGLNALTRHLYQTELGGSLIEGGTWDFNLYSKIDDVSNTSNIIVSAYRVLAGTGTITTTGTGSPRTGTVTGGAPFLPTDHTVSPAIITDSFIQTANGLLRISSVTSNTSVLEVTGISSYVNETNVPYSIWRILFTDTSNELNSTSTALNSFQSNQPAFPISATDKLGVLFYSNTDSAVSKKITLYYGGSTHASSFTSPYSKRHNDLSGLQGGLTAERYHLSLDKYNVVQNTTNTNTGDQTNISGNASTATEADKLDGQHGTYYTANSIFAAHTSNVSNPHIVTATQVGLGNVTDESKATLFTSPTFTGDTTTANTFTSTVATGSAPLVVSSTTLVTNLNADLLDGQHGSFYSANSIFAAHTSNVSNPHVVTATQVGLGSVTNESKATMFTSPTFTGDTTTANTFTSTVAIGSAPFIVTSNTMVTNLNADLLDGQHGSFYSSNSIFASHTANVSNPHTTTATQVGLGAVTNESKSTMFTSPTFTGATTTANTFTSTVATGSAPFVVASTTLVTNLNADLLDGQHGSFYSANSIFASHTSNVSNPHTTTATQVGLGNVTNESKATMFTTPTFTGATASANTFTSTVASGNAPFVVTSTTLVTNLNADLLDGQHGSFYTANSIFSAHTSNVSNPHVVTATQVGLGSVTNESKATMFTTPTFTGATTTANTFTSTVAIGNAPFVVASNTLVTNLNADLLDGQHGTYYTTANNLTGTIPSGVLPTSGVIANTYGSSTAIPVITVDDKGRLTSANTVAVNIPSGAITFIGDVTGSGTTGANTTLTLSNTGVVANTYGSSTAIPVITVDGKGRLTSASTVAVNIPSGAITFIGDVTGTGTTGANTTLTLSNSGVSIGTYNNVTVDIKGRVTVGANIAYLTSITSGNVTTALGYTPYNNTNPSGYITGITSGNVTTALGYTPYNATNPSGYITGITSGNVTTALGYTPYNATNPSGYTTNVGTVTSVSGTAPISVATGTTTPAISMAAATASVNGYMTSTYASKLDGIAAGAQTGTVTSVSGTAPISVATGTTTPAISMAAATASVNGYMTSTYASKLDGIAAGAQTGTVTSVSGTAPISVATGTTTPAISMAAATASVNGYMTSTYASKLDGIPAGGGVQGGDANRAFVETSTLITANYTITSGKNAITAGPVSIASGVNVTVPSGSNWVIVGA